MARPTKYDREIKPHIDDIRKAVESGATDKEIATAFGIAESTLYKYKKEKPEFSAAFARGREKVVIDIKAALLKKALGYEYTEEKAVAKKDKDGETVVLVETYKKHQPPSETAAAMLLRNYDSDWRDNDSAAARLKQQEQDLKKAIAKATNFDLEI
jgi:transposase-like protein